MFSFLSHEFGVVRQYRTFSNYFFTGETSRVLMHEFGVVQVHRTSSNLLEPHHCSENTVCRVCSQAFRVVRLNGTFSTYSFTEETRCAGFSYPSSGWFKRRELPRTVLNHILTEIAGRVDVFPMSSGCFAYTEPSLPTALQGKQSLQGASARVRSGSRTSNLLEPSRTTSAQIYQGV